MPPTFYLIDGHALAYRMYFAILPEAPSPAGTSAPASPLSESSM